MLDITEILNSMFDPLYAVIFGGLTIVFSFVLGRLLKRKLLEFGKGIVIAFF